MFGQRYQDQAAIVTGGASGIGAAVAERFAREGANVCLFDASEAGLREQAGRFGAAGLRVDTAVVDVSDEAAVDEATARFAASCGRLDVLVHCAGVVGPSAVNATEFSVKEFRRVLDVNLTGSFIVTRSALAHMVRRRYGRVLLVASMAGKDGNPGMAGYVASKAGMIGMVKGLGKEYAQSGVTINGLAPAVIATPMNAATAPAMLQQLTAKIPMQRFGTVEEAAALISWICSSEASFNTGFTFDLSGGRATY